MKLLVVFVSQVLGLPEVSGNVDITRAGSAPISLAEVRELEGVLRQRTEADLVVITNVIPLADW